MEHCDCYKKELVELFIRFLQKEGLTCTLSVFKTEITSLWGTNPSSGKQSKNNEVYKETIEAEDRRLKRPRSPNFQENIKPNTLSNGEAIGLVSHCIYNTSDSHVAGSARRLKWEISPPKSQGQSEQMDSNPNSGSQDSAKLHAIKYSQTLNRVMKRDRYLPDQGQNSRVIAFPLSQKGRESNYSDKEFKQKLALESKSRSMVNFEGSIRNITEGMRCDPTFQENLRSVLRTDNFNMKWLSLPQNKSDCQEINSDSSFMENETCAGDKLQKQEYIKEGTDTIIESTVNIDDGLDASVGGVLETIDLDVFLDSIHAASNH